MVKKIALDEPVEVETKLKNWGSGGLHFYISKEYLDMSGITAGVFEIEGLPMTLNTVETRTFSLPKFNRKLLDTDPGDIITVKVLGAVVRDKLEA